MDPILGNSYGLAASPVLKYREPSRQKITPMGNPYLTKQGDSLSLISKKVYGNYRKWGQIYNNNRDQIRNPNLIFAGFVLYYRSDTSLNLAQELY